jgi:hypothetical protein
MNPRLTHKDSNGTLIHRSAEVRLYWSRPRCGTTPREVATMRAGVLMEMLVPVLSKLTVPVRGPNRELCPTENERDIPVILACR